MSPQTNGLNELLETLEKESTTPNLPEVEQVKDIKSEKDLKLDNFMVKYKNRIEQWNTAHDERASLPIQWDSEYKDWIWMNRELRRQR